jgi:hypothetical protein
VTKLRLYKLARPAQSSQLTTSTSAYALHSPAMVYSTLTAMAALENPRSTPDKPQIVTVDATIFSGHSSRPLLGALRFYNKGNVIKFSPDNFQIFMLETTVRMIADLLLLRSPLFTLLSTDCQGRGASRDFEVVCRT